MIHFVALTVVIALSGLSGCAVQDHKTHEPVVADIDGPYLGGEHSTHLDSTSPSDDVDSSTQDIIQEEKNSSTQTAVGEVAVDSPVWTLNIGLLKDQMVKWGRDDATWDVIWKGDTDYYVEVSHVFYSSLDEAVIEVVKAFAGEGANIRLDHVKGNHQLIIWARGE